MIAGCLSQSSKGAEILRNLKPSEKQPILVKELDLTSPESISNMKHQVSQVLQESSDSEFFALVNNAGFMCFGDFEWLTPELLQRHVDVNLLGTMKLTHALLPLLRQSSTKKEANQGSRIINVTSHCSLAALPGLSVYAGSKAGLSMYTRGLQMELSPFNIRVINFIPGSFVFQSGIIKQQTNYFEDMWEKMDEEQKEFYDEYFHRYTGYLKMVSEMVPKEIVDVDPMIIGAFKEAISAKDPKRRYIVEPLRYKVYHFLFKILPDCRLRDYCIRRFILTPEYKMC